jgi:Ca-activated chloride channel family protein
VTIAKDVKVQVEFNPARVAGYRLIGYDNRRLADRDFTDDSKDAGEIGAGHSVTALYEIVLTGAALASGHLSSASPLKYQTATASLRVEPEKQPQVSATSITSELMTVKLRYKQPAGQTSQELEIVITDQGSHISQASADFRFASAVAMFAMLLKDSPYRGQASFDLILELAGSAEANDPQGYRAEFIELVRRARSLRTDWSQRRERPAD